MCEGGYEKSSEALIKTLEEIIARIQSGRLDSEEHVKLAVILPILRNLGWDDTNPDELIPEYSRPHAISGRVDFALCHGGKPQVFIEAKRLGRADETGEQQLFQYASNQGVPLLILTDGDTWNFYLSMSAGIPPERRFCRMVLTATDKTAEYARSFNRYLRKDRIVSGSAYNAATELYIDNQAREKANSEIPKVWRLFLEKPDPELRDMLAQAVEDESGVRPELDSLDKFLTEQLFHVPQAVTEKENCFAG